MALSRNRTMLAALLGATVLAVAGCGGDATTATPAGGEPAATESARGAVTLLQPAQAKALIDGGSVEVLDVRTPDEYAEGHVAGAQLIDFYEPDFAERIGTLDRTTTYVVYCRSGNRSGQAVALMESLGFRAVNDVDGGILAWQAAGLPVAR